MNKYKEALERIKADFKYRSENNDILLVGQMDIDAIDELIENMNFRLVYGFPVEQVILWGLMVKKSGMTIEELNKNYDLSKTIYEILKKDLLDNLKVVSKKNETR